MAIGIQEWLEEQIAAEIYNEVGLAPFRGIVRQVAPDYRPEVGELLHGVAGYPFISVVSVLAEQYDVPASNTVYMAVVRPVTVALVGDKAVVENSPALYRRYREQAIRALQLNRFRGEIAVQAGSCVFQTRVRPKSQVEPTAWSQHAKWLSAFDLLVDTREV